MTFTTLLSFLAAAATLIVACVVILRDRHSFVHQTLATGLVLLIIETLAIGFSPGTNDPNVFIFWQRVYFTIASLIPGVWILFSFVYARSNFREILWKRLWIVACAFVIPILLVVAFPAQFFGRLLVMSDPPTVLVSLGWSGYMFQLASLLTSIVVLMNLEQILRISAGRVRWQIKFIVLGVGSLFAVRIYLASQALLFRSYTPSSLIYTTGALLVADICMLRAFWRSKSLETDFYVSTTLLYNSMTLFIVGIYLILVGVVARLGFYLGMSQQITLKFFYIFLALLGLATLLLSDKLKRFLKKMLVRHFKRPYYDYRKEWAHFTEHTSHITDIVELCSTVARIIARTLDTLSVTIWLSDETHQRVVMAGSTVHAEGKFQELGETEEFVSHLLTRAESQGGTGIFDYDAVRKELPVDEDIFKKSHIDYALPLISSGKVLGMVTVGDRVGGKESYFTLEDIDLLKTMADQAAANLHNLMLSERLRKAKEMEAFQSMSAFFVHDLKNVASKLSLTMQNLPVHFENPEFRADAMKSFSQSLTKIDGMCRRLSALSQKLELKKTAANLNDIISIVVEEMKTATGASVMFEPGKLPKAFVDAEQIQKVLENLLLNAKEATQASGLIKVETLHIGKSVQCTVTDNGCGMSREFIENSLFRPFQTTKSKGMGIGLYHSKSIVEAHGGRIEVESTVGNGTTFRVFLPVADDR